MKILAIFGSPNKEGNTASLSNAILEGAEEIGHSIRRFYLYDQEIKNCLDCEDAARLHKERLCIHDDVMTKEIIPAIEEADVLVISSPVYMGHITGVMKTFFDRWHTFIGDEFKMRIVPGKKFITIITSWASTDTFRNVSEYLDHWLCKFFQLEKITQIHEGDMKGSGFIKKKKELLKKAYEIGKSIN